MRLETHNLFDMFGFRECETIACGQSVNKIQEEADTETMRQYHYAITKIYAQWYALVPSHPRQRFTPLARRY